MTWAALDDKFHGHRKLALLGPLRLPCAGLHAIAISWCADHLTDGILPRAVAEFLAGNPKQTTSNLLSTLPGFCLGPAEDPIDLLISELIRVRLWEDNRDGTYTLHNYLKYNRSRRFALQVRKKRAKAGRLGGLATAKHFAKQVATVVLSSPSPSPSPSYSKEETTLRAPQPHAPRTRKTAVPEAAVRTVLDAYHAAFLTATGEKPNITGQDAATAKRLITRHGAEKVLALLAAMYASGDPFIAQSGRTLGVLSSQWNKLVTANGQSPVKRPGRVNDAWRDQPRGEVKL